ncbi:hypothetical protein MNB_SV-5-645 [hydrothermal vent metagenome]|uniref:VanZ-like domain-containing protein n=1 Tax=hydrothermal vent metagenome TaxID=652676 RepID=A0A1W1EG11_9ZZZZ
MNFAYKIKWWNSALYLLFYGVFIEFSQYFTPNRCVEFLDIVADSIGIVIGLIIYYLYKKLEAINANS